MGYAGKLSDGCETDGAVQAALEVLDFGQARRQVARSPFWPMAPAGICGSGVDRAAVEACVKNIIKERRERAAFFPDRLFADPAWEILLALTLAQARQHRLDVTNLCHRVNVPATTVLRWIGTMVEEGILLRQADKTDGRRKYVELSPESWAKMGEYVSAILPTLSRAA